MKHGTMILAMVVCTASSAVYSNSLTDSLVGYFSFDGNIADTSGTGITTSMHGAQYTTGVHGQALYMPGNEDHVQLHDHPVLELGSHFTIAFWQHIDSTSSSGGWIISKHLAFENVTGWQITTHSSGNTGLGIFGSKGGSGSTVTPLNTTAHMLYTGDLTEGKLRKYVNGVLVSEGDFFGAPNTNNYNVWIGAHYGISSREIDGWIDDLRFYDRALNESEIGYLAAGLLEAPPQVPAPAIVGIAPFFIAWILSKRKSLQTLHTP